MRHTSGVFLFLLSLFGLPTAAHASWGGCFNLEVIAAEPGTVATNDDDGSSLYTDENGVTVVSLSDGSFAVTDFDGTDGSASFSLPAPDPTGSGVPAYDAFGRYVGEPDTS